MSYPCTSSCVVCRSARGRAAERDLQGLTQRRADRRHRGAVPAIMFTASKCSTPESCVSGAFMQMHAYPARRSFASRSARRSLSSADDSRLSAAYRSRSPSDRARCIAPEQLALPAQEVAVDQRGRPPPCSRRRAAPRARGIGATPSCVTSVRERRSAPRRRRAAATRAAPGRSRLPRPRRGRPRGSG